MTAPFLLLNPPHRSTLFPEYRAFTLRILKADIDQMEYHWNESPMCDVRSQNAIVYALSREVKQNSGVMQIASVDSKMSIVIQKISYPLGDHLSSWYTKAERGFRMKPVSSLIYLPRRLMARRINRFDISG